MGQRFGRLTQACVLALGLWPVAGHALDLSLPPAARNTAETVTDPDSYSLPIGVFADGRLPALEVSGRVIRRAWQVPLQGMTTLQMMAPLKEQVLAAGFEPLLECADRACGGFDFRYAADLFQAPAMIVDLFDYRVLTARRGEGADASYVMLLVSHGGSEGYIQAVLIEASDQKDGLTRSASDDAAPAPATPLPPVPKSPDALATRLERDGHVILSDLDFGVGSSDLSEGSYASLTALADFLKGSPDLRVALVGHTDVQGALDGNIALSRRRAQSVLERLVERHGVARGQLDAEGMGYLAPVASNLTPAGREANRRVEAVLLNSELPKNE